MTDVDFEDLTPAQRRAYIRTQIPLTTWFNRTGAEILRDLEARGYGIPQSTFYSIRREKLNPSDLQQAIQHLGPNDTIPVAYAEHKPDWNLSENYLMQYKVVGRDPSTGDKKVGFFALSFDKSPALQQATDAIGGLIEGSEEHYEIIAEEIEPYKLYRKN